MHSVVNGAYRDDVPSFDQTSHGIAAEYLINRFLLPRVSGDQQSRAYPSEVELKERGCVAEVLFRSLRIGETRVVFDRTTYQPILLGCRPQKFVAQRFMQTSGHTHDMLEMMKRHGWYGSSLMPSVLLDPGVSIAVQHKSGTGPRDLSISALYVASADNARLEYVGHVHTEGFDDIHAFTEDPHFYFELHGPSVRMSNGDALKMPMSVCMHDFLINLMAPRIVGWDECDFLGSNVVKKPDTVALPFILG